MQTKTAVRRHQNQRGFGLVEIMVGLAIGLIATLVIVQVVSTFEGKKRTTGGTADAQTNGAVALYAIQRQAQMAGYGLPVFSYKNQPLDCDIGTAYDPDNDPATLNSIGLFPVRVVDGANGASDTLIVRSGQTPMGGVPVGITNASPVSADVSVINNFGCQAGDVVLVANGSSCVMTSVSAGGIPDPEASTTQITLQSVTGIATGAELSCLSNWRERTYAVDANTANLLESGVPSVAGVVSIQVQYGVAATAKDNQVNQWVNASGATWGSSTTTPTLANRNRIKALRVAIVARSSLYEKDEVTAPCTTTKGIAHNGPCAWSDSDLDTDGDGTSDILVDTPVINLAADPDWRHYRYRVFDTVIPLRNLIWAKDTLL